MSYYFDEGVKISIHPHNEPPSPNELGVAVPHGTHFRQSVFADWSTKHYCNELKNYSVSDCKNQCWETGINNQCHCSYTHDGELPACKTRQFCCVTHISTDTLSGASANCACPIPCSYTSYSTSVSYSSFPAQSYIDAIRLSDLL